MKRLLSVILLCVRLVMPSIVWASQVSQPDHQNISHELLGIENDLGVVTPGMYMIIDSVIADAKARLATQTSFSTEADALSVFRTIDDVLTDHNIIPPGDLVNLLSTGLKGKVLNDQERSRLAGNFYNRSHPKRPAHIMANPNTTYYLLDCDLLSAIYLAIADSLQLPIYMIEVPRHNFVRWYFSDGRFVNWETLEAKQTTIDDYRFYGLTDELVAKGVYFTKMSHDEVLGYWHFLRALEWEKQGQFSKAITDYRTAVTAYPRTGKNQDNLSWLFSTCPKAPFRDGPKSVQFAEAAVAIQPRNEDYLDTEACAYAEIGNFVKAAELEDQVVQVMPTDTFVARRNGFRNQTTCHDDVQPQMRQKMSMRLQGNH